MRMNLSARGLMSLRSASALVGMLPEGGRSRSVKRVPALVAVVALLGVLLPAAALAVSPAYSNGFEANTFDWNVFGGNTITQRSSGYVNPGGYASGIAAAAGSFYAGLGRGTCANDSPAGGGGPTVNCPGAFTRWGGYNSTWTGGWTTQVDVYLDTAYAQANADSYSGNITCLEASNPSTDPVCYGTRFDYTSAVNNAAGNFIRDFGFNVATGSALLNPSCAGFSVTAGMNVNRSGANAYANPQCISTAGWYTFKHTFSANAGFLNVLMQIIPVGSTTPTASWNIVSPDPISSGDPTKDVGCNRYGWFSDQEIYGLPIDNASMTGCGNSAPTADAGGPYSGAEGAAIPISGTAGDTDGDTVTTAWTYSGGTGTCTFGNAAALSTTVTCTDEGTYSLTLTADDGVNPAVTSNATLTVSNVNPVVSISAPAFDSIHAINTTVSLTAPFTDAGTADPHTCTIDWGAGAAPVAGTMTETVGSGAGTCSGTGSYAAAGIYEITVVVTDGDGADGTGIATTEVVIYDPSAGFVTGGGWINSPAGAYKADATMTGKANFGFVSKYQKGATTPTGTTQFQFQTGNLDFHSSAYQWLVVNQGGTNAQFKGAGTINGVGTYGFMIWAGDGSPDTFRIQITDSLNNVVYDNGVQQALGSGSIVIHTK